LVDRQMVINQSCMITQGDYQSVNDATPVMR
jgi:hypothetical protein